MIHPGESKDYFYPNAIPQKVEWVNGRWEPVRNGPDGGRVWDYTEVSSTAWYHDHAEDITAHNALMGLAGFLLVRDDEERRWIAEGKLPAVTREAPCAIRDVCLVPVTDPAQMDPEIAARVAAEGLLGEARIHFDPFDHDGSLGNTSLINGAAFPVLTAALGKHRLRILNASLARFYLIKFVAVLRPPAGTAVPEGITPDQISAPMAVLRVGKDSWLMPQGIEDRAVFLAMANRGDVVIDLKQTVTGPDGRTWDPSEYDVYMVSVLDQADGRGPGHGDNVNDGAAAGRGTPMTAPEQAAHTDWLWMMKIAFERDLAGAVVRVPDAEDAPLCVPGVALRAHEPIINELVALGIDPTDTSKIPRREFDFERSKGAWQINHRFYDAAVTNAVPEVWSTELWVLRNRSGGWWHPIHIHLESHQEVFIKARDVTGAHVHMRNPLYPMPGGDNGAEISGPTSGDSAFWNLDIKHDTSVLGPNTEVHILMRFRTFQGPFVFHCHNLNHEDMRMMFQFDPRLEGAPATDLPMRPEFWFYTEEIP